MSSLIYTNPPYIVEDTEYLSNTSYMNIGIEPFSSSSMVMIRVPSYSKREVVLFIVTRDLKFVEFRVSEMGTGEKQLTKVNEIELDSSLEYSKCRDLTFIKDKEMIPPSQNFILFCKGIRDQNENFYTIVLIKRLVYGKTTAGYIVFPESSYMPVIPDFNKTSQGLRYLKEVDDYQSNVKYFTTRATDRVNGTEYNVIMGLNIGILRLIGEGQVIEVRKPILNVVKYMRMVRSVLDGEYSEY